MPIIVVVGLLVILRVMLHWVRSLGDEERRTAERNVVKGLGLLSILFVLMCVTAYLGQSDDQQKLRDKARVPYSCIKIDYSKDTNELGINLEPTNNNALDFFVNDFMLTVSALRDEHFARVILYRKASPVFWISGNDFSELCSKAKSSELTVQKVALYSNFPAYVRPWDKTEALAEKSDGFGGSKLADEVLLKWTGLSKEAR